MAGVPSGAPMPAPTPARRPTWPRARALLSGGVGALAAIALFASLSFPVSAFSVNLSAGFGLSGVTELRVPPFGEVWAKTHRGPLVLRVTLASVDPDQLRRLVMDPSKDDALRRARADLVRAAERLAAWTLVLAVAGGACGSLLGRATLREAATGAAVGLAMIVALGGWTYATYDASAFRTPQYAGALRAAPWVVGLVDTGVSRARELGRQMTLIAGNMYRLFGAVNSFQPPAGPASGGVTVLLVSDIHSNPVGIDLIRQVTASYHPDFILDSGDLDDYGTALEGTFLKGLKDLKVPYVIVPGNHDSPAELAELASLPNVRVLQSGEIRVDGVPIVGEADPSSRRPSPDVASPRELAAQEDALRLDILEAQVPPAIVVGHNPVVVRPLLGLAKVLVAGHTHRLDMRQERGSVYLNPGTTGAAGLRGFLTSEGTPYSLMILYLAPDGRGGFVPRAVDMVEVTHNTGDVKLERRVFPGSPTLPASESPPGN